MTSLVNASMLNFVKNSLQNICLIFPFKNLSKKKKITNHSILEAYNYQNIFYCCTQKTASQWFKSIFNDPIIFQHTGLKVFPFDQYLEVIYKTNAGLCETKWDLAPFLYRNFSNEVALPAKTIATHFYMSYDSYNSIPKPDTYKTFFILRDPRDIVISWYFSISYSHSPIGRVPKFRDDLKQLSLEEGINYSIKKLNDRGLFNGQLSWLTISDQPNNVKIFRYEDFANDNNLFLNDLLLFLDVKLSQKEFNDLCDKHLFKKFSSGRHQGEEDFLSHYRKGISGDWENHFTKTNKEYFRKTTGDLLEMLGYSE